MTAATTIAEKKRGVGAIFGFLFVIFALAAWRGMQGAPVLAAASGIAAIALAVFLAWVYVTPAPVLSISPQAIDYGRRGKPGTRIERNETGRLAFHQGLRRSGPFLVLVDEPTATPLVMRGFDLGEVAAACIAQGWTFGDGGAVVRAEPLAGH